MLEYGLAFAGVRVTLPGVKIPDSTCDRILPATYIPAYPNMYRNFLRDAECSAQKQGQTSRFSISEPMCSSLLLDVLVFCGGL